MNVVKTLVSLPLLVALIVFAFMNNDMATFNFWPFYIEITVSLSVAVIAFVVLGFVWGLFYSWASYAPEIRQQKKINKKLNKTHKKLAEELEDLQKDLDSLKKTDPSSELEGKPLKKRFKEFFSRKKTISD